MRLLIFAAAVVVTAMTWVSGYTYGRASIARECTQKFSELKAQFDDLTIRANTVNESWIAAREQWDRDAAELGRCRAAFIQAMVSR